VAKRVFQEKGLTIPYKVGTMIEVPRAAITADEIAKQAEFFSFGTNDLTQTTFGFSRDDSGKFICLRVLSPRLPVIDQVIAKSLYLLTNPRPSIDIDHDMLFKVAFLGSDPEIEWPWIKSISLATLGDDFSSLIGVDFAVKRIETMDHVIKLQMWYLNCVNRFKSVGARYIHGAMGGVVLWNASEDPSKIGDLQRSINDFYFCNERSMPTIIIGLCDDANGRKGDEEAPEVGEDIARRNNIPFFRCELGHPSTTEAPLKYLANTILKMTSACASR
jgi:hypothetical protein